MTRLERPEIRRLLAEVTSCGACDHRLPAELKCRVTGACVWDRVRVAVTR